MTIRVSGPDGATFDFPDGTPQQTMLRMLRQHYASTKWAATPKPGASLNPYALGAEYGGTGGVPPVSRTMGAAVLQGLVDPVEGAANLVGLVPGASALAAHVPGWSSLASWAQALRERAQKAPTTRFLADVANPLNYLVPEAVGDAVMPEAAGAARAIGRGALEGATAGALQPVPGGKPDAVMEALQMLGGAGGDLALRGLGSIIGRPVSKEARELLNQGVRLTPGALTGSAGSTLATLLDRVPGAGVAVAQGDRRMVEDFDRAIWNEVLRPLGASLPPGTAARDMAGLARDPIDTAYGTAVPNLVFTPNQQFLSEFGGIRNDLSPALRGGFDNIVRDRLPWLYGPAPAWKKLTGSEFANKVSWLRRQGKILRLSPDPEKREIGNALKLFVRSMTDNAAETAPGMKALKANADNAYANYLIARKAGLARPVDLGLFTPKDLIEAAKNLEPSDRLFAESRARLQAPAQRAFSVMGNPPLVAHPSLLGGALELGLGARAVYHPEDIAVPLLGLGATMGGYSRPGMEALSRWALSPAREAIGKAIRKGAAAARVVIPSAMR
jgi:hypothetical protein